MGHCQLGQNLKLCLNSTGPKEWKAQENETQKDINDLLKTQALKTVTCAMKQIKMASARTGVLLSWWKAYPAHMKP